MKEKILTEDEVRKRLADLLDANKGVPIKGWNKIYLRRIASGGFPLTPRVLEFLKVKASVQYISTE